MKLTQHLATKIAPKKLAFTSAIGVLGSIFNYIFGGWGMGAYIILTALLLCILLDVATGWIVAAVFKKSKKTKSGGLKSSVGIKGLFSKVGILCAIVLASLVEAVLGVIIPGYPTDTHLIIIVTMIAFVANEALSIVENLGLMGCKIPPIILKAIDILNEKGNSTEVENDVQ